MGVDSYLFIAICYIILFIASFIISTKLKFYPVSSRFESIDGLRGLLASGVFIHHTVIWYNYLQTNNWVAPRNNLASFLGEGCVALFFMITAFLFANKIINTKNQDNKFWLTTILSRIFRIYPLYIVFLLAIIVVVFIKTDFTLHQTFTRFIVAVGKWLSCTILGNPSINGADILPISAGVAWSLPYEWFFYLALPLISILLCRKFNFWAILISLIGVIGFLNYFQPNWFLMLSFIGGIIPALILKINANANLNKWYYSVIVVLSLLTIIIFYSDLNRYVRSILLILVFIIITLKNDMFGILKQRFLAFLGEISYSTYLVHGLILFCTFSLIGLENVKTFSALEYTGIAIIICPIVVIISALSYYMIEKKSMDYFNKKKAAKR